MKALFVIGLIMLIGGVIGISISFDKSIVPLYIISLLITFSSIITIIYANQCEYYSTTSDYYDLLKVRDNDYCTLEIIEWNKMCRMFGIDDRIIEIKGGD